MAACLLMMASVSAFAQNEPIALGSEIMPKDTARQARLSNRLIAPKGEWQCGISLMYADFNSANSDYMMLLQGVGARASLMRIAPEAAYTFKNNHAVGVKFNYTKAGGMLDLYGAMKESVPDGVNNYLNLEGQIMLKAHAAIKYGWEFKKWGLDLRALVTLPVVGIITADHPSEPALSILGGNDHSIMNRAFKHVFLGSYHNYMSLDYEVGVDFVFKPCTITIGFGSTRKWWNIYDIQNIRKINYSTIGVAFDIVSRDKFKSSNKNF